MEQKIIMNTNQRIISDGPYTMDDQAYEGGNTGIVRNRFHFVIARLDYNLAKVLVKALNDINRSVKDG